MVFEKIAGPVRAEVVRDGGTVTGAVSRRRSHSRSAPRFLSRHSLPAPAMPDLASAAAVHAPRIASVGIRQVFAELPNLAALAAARPDPAALLAAEAALPLDGAPPLLQLWTRISAGAVRARVFGPTLGVLEDPATGSAAGALGGLLGEGEHLVIEHRIEMGRTSRIEVFVHGWRCPSPALASSCSNAP